MTYEEYLKTRTSQLYKKIPKEQKSVFFRDCFQYGVNKAKSVIHHFQNEFPEDFRLQKILNYCETIHENQKDYTRHNTLQLCISVNGIPSLRTTLSNKVVTCLSNLIYSIHIEYSEKTIDINDREPCTKSWLPASMSLAEMINCCEADAKDQKTIDQFYQNSKRFIHGLYCNILKPIDLKFNKKWRTSDCVNLAKQIYDSKDFSLMPILADALQESGMNHEGVLNHLRYDKDFTRADWILWKLTQ